jgi:tetratricopeptide (TPR) repeat protein
MGEAVGPNFHESTLSARALAALRDDPEVFSATSLGTAELSRVYSVLATYISNNRDGKVDLTLARELSDRALALANEANNPSSIAFALFARTLATARDEPDVALEAIERCLELDRSGATMRSGGPHYIGALLLARRGERTQALTRLRTAIALLAPRGRTPELDGAFGYAIETCLCLGLFEVTAVILGAVLGGPLESLRDMPVPPDRTAPDVRAIRDTLGRARFDACVEQGKRMTYDELAAWLTDQLASEGAAS